MLRNGICTMCSIYEDHAETQWVTSVWDSRNTLCLCVSPRQVTYFYIWHHWTKLSTGYCLAMVKVLIRYMVWLGLDNDVKSQSQIDMYTHSPPDNIVLLTNRSETFTWSGRDLTGKAPNTRVINTWYWLFLGASTLQATWAPDEFTFPRLSRQAGILGRANSGLLCLATNRSRSRTRTSA